MLLSVAWADTPLLHDGPPETAVARVVASGGGPAWELDPLRPDQLMAHSQAGLVGISSSCQRAPAGAADLRKSVQFAEEMFERQNWEAAARHIRQARAELPCLVDETDAVQAAHLHLLAGIVAREQGRTEDVADAFDRAQRFGSDTASGTPLQWNDRLASPDRGADALARAGEALLQAPRGTVRFAPGVDPGRLDLRIDGRAVPLRREESLSLPVGYHHVQVVSSGPSGRVVRTFEIDLTEDVPIVVADPAGLTSLALGPHVNTPALGDFIRAAGLRGTTRVVAGDAVWTFDTEWTQLPAVDLHAAERTQRLLTRRRTAGFAAMAGGVLVSGLGLWGMSTVWTGPEFEQTTDLQDWRTRQYIPWAATEAVGVSALVTGAVLVIRSPAPGAP